MWDINLTSACTTNLPSLVSIFHINQTPPHKGVTRTPSEITLFAGDKPNALNRDTYINNSGS